MKCKHTLDLNQKMTSLLNNVPINLAFNAGFPARDFVPGFDLRVASNAGLFERTVNVNTAILPKKIRTIEYFKLFFSKSVDGKPGVFLF